MLIPESEQVNVLDGGLAEGYIPISEDEAAACAQKHYGVVGAMTRFATEKDDTFRIRADDGRTYVFKIGNSAEPLPEIDFQVKLLEHIARVAPALPVPRVFPTRGGQALLQFTDNAKQRRSARLMSYVHGTALDSTGSSSQERVKVGEVLARLRLATAGFSHPADDRVLAWDVKNLLCLRPLLQGIEDAGRRARLAQGMDRFVLLRDRMAQLHTQVLHNDFSKSNIVVDHDSAEFVTGIIDFGDAVRTAVAIDVSTALLNQLPRDAAACPVDDLFSEGRDVLRGYLQYADLTREELALIPHLTMARVVARALISLSLAKKFPDNAKYLLRNTEQGWAQLDWFLERSIDEVSATFESFASPIMSKSL